MKEFVNICFNTSAFYFTDVPSLSGMSSNVYNISLAIIETVISRDSTLICSYVSLSHRISNPR